MNNKLNATLALLFAAAGIFFMAAADQGNNQVVPLREYPFTGLANTNTLYLKPALGTTNNGENFLRIDTTEAYNFDLNSLDTMLTYGFSSSAADHKVAIYAQFGSHGNWKPKILLDSVVKYNNDAVKQTTAYDSIVVGRSIYFIWKKDAKPSGAQDVRFIVEKDTANCTAAGTYYMDINRSK